MALRERSYSKLKATIPSDTSLPEQFKLALSRATQAQTLQIFFDKKFSDFHIITRDSVTIPVHKCVLAALSPYFHAVFSPEYKEGLSRCLRFSDLTFDQIMPILYQLYGKEMDVTPDNVVSLLITADRLRIQFLINKYIVFMKEKTNVTNSIGVWIFAETYWFPVLINHAKTLIKENFMEVSTKDEFKDLPHEYFFLLLAEAELNCKSEMHILAAICQWAISDFSIRKEQAMTLMTTIRYAHMQERNFNEQMLEPFKPVCNDLIREFFKTANDYKLYQSEGLPPRMPYEIVFVIGGWSGREPKNSIEIYNPITQQWNLSVMSLPELRIYYAAVEIDNVIYIMGGFDNVNRGLKSVWAFYPTEEKWEKKASMLQPRCYASAVVFKGVIYVMGGYDESIPPVIAGQRYPNPMGGTRFKSVEKYSPQKDQWTRCTDMLFVRSDGAAVTMHNNIYCIGGFTGEEIHKTVEWCDPTARKGHGEWYYAAEMNIKRSGVSCEVMDDFIYAVGGFNGVEQLDSIERYNSYFNIWELIAHMKVPRSNMGLIRVDDRLLIVGGYGNEYTTPLCEEFTPRTRQFTEVDDLPLADGCSGIKLVTTRGFHVSRQFT